MILFTERKNDYRQFLENIVENSDYGYGNMFSVVIIFPLVDDSAVLFIFSQRKLKMFSLDTLL